MNLFYTVTTGYNDEQPNPDRSLGGYKSSTMVVNDDFSNIFDELSVLTIKNGRDEYRAIILKNEYNVPISKIKMKMVVPEDSMCTYKVAIAPLDGVDKYNKRFMENVATINNKPFHADFVDMGGDAVLNIEELQPGEEIGLWICRSVNKEEARKQYMEVCEPDPADPTGRRFKPVTHLKEEKVDFVIEWL